MTSFPEREHGFEAKFVRDEEIKFKAAARRDSLVAHWAAQKLGLTGTAEREYLKRLLSIDLENPGTDSVFKRLRADFDAAGVAQSDEQIRHAMDEFMKQAFAQIKAGF
jgi:hypothetical protein